LTNIINFNSLFSECLSLSFLNNKIIVQLENSNVDRKISNKCINLLN